jgi:hypothetical protein
MPQEEPWGHGTRTKIPLLPSLHQQYQHHGTSHFEVQSEIQYSGLLSIFFKPCNLVVKTAIFPCKFSGRSKVKSGPFLISEPF